MLSLTDEWHPALHGHALALLDQLHVDLLRLGGVGGVARLGVGALALLADGVVHHLELVHEGGGVAGLEVGLDVVGRGRGGRREGVAGEVDRLDLVLGEVVVGARAELLAVVLGGIEECRI